MLDISETQNRIMDALAESGITADDEACEKLAVYMNGVLERNKVMNLTAITEPEKFITDHIVDSAAILNTEEYQKAKTVCDVGTGAGFPGTVLAALSPEKEFTLIDSLKKRLNVIEELAKECGMTNIKLVHARAEDAGHDRELRESFDVVTARAVASLPVLSELGVPLVKKGGAFIAYKTRTGIEEIKGSRHAANILGVGSMTIQDAGVKGTDHVLVVMKKAGKTPGKYPRKAGDPARNPL